MPIRGYPANSLDLTALEIKIDGPGFSRGALPEAVFDGPGELRGRISAQ
jgi:hypothetical protein